MDATPNLDSLEVIEQPPDVDDGDDGIALPIDVGELRGAFVEGARITLLLFGLWGLYVLLKVGVRYLLRTQRISLDLPLPWKRK